MENNFLYKEISYQIRGTCFWVWKEFRNAFKETIVDNALTEELRRRGLKVENQKRIDIFYRGHKVGTYVPDKIINERVLLGVKYKPFLTQGDIKQFWRYLKGTDYKLGFLINFGGKTLQIKRVVYDLARKKDLREDLRSRSASKSAFTLMEALVAISIFIIIASIGVFALRNVQPNLRLSGTTRDLVSDLRYAQQLAVTEQFDHGVWFSTTTEDKYQIIRHEDSTTTIIKEVVLPEGINFQYISPLTDNEIRFNPYGAAREAATTTLVNTENKTKTIRVSPSGFVKILD